MAVQQSARHHTQWAKCLQQCVRTDQPCCPWELLGTSALEVRQAWWLWLTVGRSGSAVCRCHKVNGLAALEEGSLALEWGVEASFPCAQSTALHVTIMPVPVVYLVESRAERAVCTCSAPCAAWVMCSKPHLWCCVGSFPSLVLSLWPVCWDHCLAGGTGWPRRLKAGPSHLTCQTSLSSSANDIRLLYQSWSSWFKCSVTKSEIRCAVLVKMMAKNQIQSENAAKLRSQILSLSEKRDLI